MKAVAANAPCFVAFLDEAAFPSGVRGPVDASAAVWFIRILLILFLLIELNYMKF
jgi:hypothetical protein